MSAYGTSGGVEITDAVIDRLAAEAEAGYEPTRPRGVDPYPDCPGEFHGADGGACGVCGWDSHPIPR